jgi:hypothetical protein
MDWADRSRDKIEGALSFICTADLPSQLTSRLKCLGPSVRASTQPLSRAEASAAHLRHALPAISSRLTNKRSKMISVGQNVPRIICILGIVCIGSFSPQARYEQPKKWPAIRDRVYEEMCKLDRKAIGYKQRKWQSEMQVSAQPFESAARRSFSSFSSSVSGYVAS